MAQTLLALPMEKSEQVGCTQITIARVILSGLLSGILLGLSQPLVISALGETPIDPTGLTGLLSFVAYVPVIFGMYQCRSVWQAFALGFAATFIQYLMIIHWFGIAMTVFGGVPLLLSVMAVLLSASILGSFIGFAFAAAWYVSKKRSLPLWYVLPASITMVEFLKNYAPFGGFPWGNIGNSLATVPLLLQAAALVGVYGLVFYIVFVNVAIVDAISKKKSVVLALSVTLLFVGFGGWRLWTYSPASMPTLKVALLQGNIEQGIKNHANIYAREILSRYKRLQDAAATQHIDLAIWPEAALPTPIITTAKQLIPLGANVPQMIAGAVMMEPGTPGVNGGEPIFHNSAVVLGPQFEVLGRADKIHLVPFGEYVPWPFQGIVSKVVPNLGAFYPGKTFEPIKMHIRDGLDVAVGITICYEGVFPEISRGFANHGASLLVNVTNDAWYGISSAPYQHLAMYQLRAVETGRAFARATNTGVSGIIDPRGHVHQATSLYTEASVIANVPLSQETTPYMLWGDVIAWLSLAFMAISLFIARFRTE